MSEVERIKERLKKIGNEAPPKVIEANQRRLLELIAVNLWVEPTITAGFAQMSADGWIGGVTLYRNDGQPVTFYSIEEMRAATLAGQTASAILEMV